jgi:hypothetical protein
MNALDPAVAETPHTPEHREEAAPLRHELQTRKQPILGRFWHASAIFAALLASIRAPRSKVKSVQMSSAGRIVERGAISAGAVNLAAADRRAPGVVQLFAK